jgi:hypothetical protein
MDELDIPIADVLLDLQVHLLVLHGLLEFLIVELVFQLVLSFLSKELLQLLIDGREEASDGSVGWLPHVEQGLVGSDFLLLDSVFSNVLLHDGVVEADRVFVGQAVFDLATLGLDNKGPLWVDNIRQVVILCLDHLFAQTLLVTKCSVLLLNQSTGGRLMFSLPRVVVFAHNLEELFHLQVVLAKYLDFLAFLLWGLATG